MDYVFHQMMGMHTQLPSFLMNFHKVDILWDLQAYISRISQSNRAMNQLLERARAQAAQGILPPRFSFEVVLKQCKDIISGALLKKVKPCLLYGEICNTKLVV